MVYGIRYKVYKVEEKKIEDRAAVPPLIRALGRDPVVFLSTLAASGYHLSLIDPDKGSLSEISPAETVADIDAHPRNISLLACIMRPTKAPSWGYQRIDTVCGNQFTAKGMAP